MTTQTELLKLQADYDELTQINDHTGAALLLTNYFATPEQKEWQIKELERIQRDSEKAGFISVADLHVRDVIGNGYFYMLKNLLKNKDIMQNTNEKNELLDRFRKFFIESDQTTEEAAVNMADLEKMSVKRLQNLCVNFNI